MWFMYAAEAAVAAGISLILGFVTRWAWEERKER